MRVCMWLDSGVVPALSKALRQLWRPGGHAVRLKIDLRSHVCRSSPPASQSRSRDGPHCLSVASVHAGMLYTAGRHVPGDSRCTTVAVMRVRDAVGGRQPSAPAHAALHSGQDGGVAQRSRTLLEARHQTCRHQPCFSGEKATSHRLGFSQWWKPKPYARITRNPGLLRTSSTPNDLVNARSDAIFQACSATLQLT